MYRLKTVCTHICTHIVNATNVDKTVHVLQMFDSRYKTHEVNICKPSKRATSDLVCGHFKPVFSNLVLFHRLKLAECNTNTNSRGQQSHKRAVSELSDKPVSSGKQISATLCFN